MSDSQQPPRPDAPPTGPPSGPPLGGRPTAPPTVGAGPLGSTAPPLQTPAAPGSANGAGGASGAAGQSTFTEPAAQPYLGGYHGPDWIPELGVQAASAGARVGAKVLDVVVIVMLLMVVSVGGMFLLVASSDEMSNAISTGGSLSFSSGPDLVATMGVNLAILLVDFLYNVVVVARFGGQPGKLVLGLRIIGTDGRPADLRRAFLRWSPVLALTVLSWLPTLALAVLVVLLRISLLVANLVLVLVDERHRSVFDRVAGTYVITTR